MAMPIVEEKMRGRQLFAKYKPIINILVGFYSIFPKKMRQNAFVRIRKKTGSIALVQRYALLKTLAKRIGDNVAVFPDVYLQNIQELEIGNNVSFQPMVYIEAYGGVKIGDDVSMAEGSSIFSVNHGFEDIEKPIKDQPLTSLPVVIENNVWIGAKATILGGVTISTGTIVAAGAVVHDSTETYSTVGGVPAKKIRSRMKENR